MRNGTGQRSRPDHRRPCRSAGGNACGRRPAGTGGGEPHRNRAAGNGDRQRQLVVVQFKGHRKSYYHNDVGADLRVGDYCLVEADRGKDLGRVCYIGPGEARWWRIADRQGVIRKATAQELARLHDIRADEWGDYDVCLEKIQARKLEMNLVTVERQFDRNKITFYFTAEHRVDFRQLVKDLAAVFRTRIELRQIGVRDEAKIKGGLGICGRELCCSSFLHEFNPVTLKMAKAQQLPLSPSKLSGLCGRLRCCLAYEVEGYRRALERLPKVGTRVRCPAGAGIVRKVDLLLETVTVAVADRDETVACTADQLEWNRDQDLPAPRGGRRRGGGGRSNQRGTRHR